MSTDLEGGVTVEGAGAVIVSWQDDWIWSTLVPNWVPAVILQEYQEPYIGSAPQGQGGPDKKEIVGMSGPELDIAGKDRVEDIDGEQC